MPVSRMNKEFKNFSRGDRRSDHSDDVGSAGHVWLRLELPQSRREASRALWMGETSLVNPQGLLERVLSRFQRDAEILAEATDQNRKLRSRSVCSGENPDLQLRLGLKSRATPCPLHPGSRHHRTRGPGHARNLIARTLSEAQGPSVREDWVLGFLPSLIINDQVPRLSNGRQPVPPTS